MHKRLANDFPSNVMKKKNREQSYAAEIMEFQPCVNILSCPTAIRIIGFWLQAAGSLNVAISLCDGCDRTNAFFKENVVIKMVRNSIYIGRLNIA